MNILKCDAQYTLLEMVSYHISKFILNFALASCVAEMTVYTIIIWFNLYLINIILTSLLPC